MRKYSAKRGAMVRRVRYRVREDFDLKSGWAFKYPKTINSESCFLECALFVTAGG